MIRMLSLKGLVTVTAWNSKEAIDRWVRGERENDHLGEMRILNRPLAHTRARTRDLLHTTTTVTLKASLPIAPQKPRPLQSKGNYYFRASDVTD